MSTLIELLPRVAEEARKPAAVEFPVEEAPVATASARDLMAFAEEQTCGLVRQIFLTGTKKNARQVLFSAVDDETDVAELCMRVGEALAWKNSGTTCVVEALPRESPTDVCEINCGPSYFQKNSAFCAMRRNSFPAVCGSCPDKFCWAAREPGSRHSGCAAD